MARRERPATCYTCSGDVEPTPRFGNEARCDACCRRGPVAVYAFEQPDFAGGTLRMYHVLGGEHDRSTVTRATLDLLGIPVLPR